jgi:hypothetical protein
MVWRVNRQRLMMKRAKRPLLGLTCIVASTSVCAANEPSRAPVEASLGSDSIAYHSAVDWPGIAFGDDSARTSPADAIRLIGMAQTDSGKATVEYALPAELREPARASSGVVENVVPIAEPDSDPKDSDSTLPVDRDIRSIGLDITVSTGSVPASRVPASYETTQDASTIQQRMWQDDVYFWESPAICHRPLFFEEPRLERGGHVRYPLIRPAVSGGIFFTHVATLPYRSLVSPAYECNTSSQSSPRDLGRRRPYSLD